MGPPPDFVYPAWFNRVYAKTTDDPEPEDFDEDISELGDGETPDIDDDGEADEKFDSYKLFAEQNRKDLTIDPLAFYQKIYNLYCPEYKDLTYVCLLLELDPGFLEFRIVDEDKMEINGNLVIDQYNLSEHRGQEAQTTAGMTEYSISLGPNEGVKNWSTKVNLTEDTGE